MSKKLVYMVVFALLVVGVVGPQSIVNAQFDAISQSLGFSPNCSACSSPLDANDEELFATPTAEKRAKALEIVEKNKKESRNSISASAMEAKPVVRVAKKIPDYAIVSYTNGGAEKINFTQYIVRYSDEKVVGYMDIMVKAIDDKTMLMKMEGPKGSKTVKITKDGYLYDGDKRYKLNELGKVMTQQFQSIDKSQVKSGEVKPQESICDWIIKQLCLTVGRSACLELCAALIVGSPLASFGCLAICGAISYWGCDSALELFGGC